MKNSERPASIALLRQRAQQRQPKPAARPKHSPQTVQLGVPPPTAAETRRGSKGSSRGYNPYDTVTTRLPDVWHAKPRRA
jgi:hypothetical protein